MSENIQEEVEEVKAENEVVDEVQKESSNNADNESIFIKSFEGLLKKVKRLEILNYIVLVLLFVSMAFNFIGMTRDFGHSSTNTENRKQLPKNLDKVAANKIINEIKQYYNEDDEEKLYNFLGEYAKTLVSFDEFKKSMSSLKMLGKISSASFTDYTYLENRNGADWFTLNYVAKYENGNGNAAVSIKASGDEWEVAGFKFNVDRLNSNQN
ncbi:MAG TPA: hypothetical protein VF941_05155 [Clostridia bacterium]